MKRMMNNVSWTLAALFALAWTSNSALAEPDGGPTPRTSWNNAKNYVLFYGPVVEADLAALASYDIVVIDPAAWPGSRDSRKTKIKALKDSGCFVLGYLSCFEVADWHAYKDRVEDGWKLRLDGDYWRPWGANHAVSLAEPGFRTLLADLVKSEVLDYGCDGVFMDTLADLDHPKLPKDEQARQREGLARFLADLRKTRPGIRLVANWTLQDTLSAVAPYVDAVCWENFDPANLADKPGSPRGWMMGIRNRLAAEQAKHPFRVFTLWNVDNPGKDIAQQQAQMKAISASFGFLPYCCTNDYHNVKPDKHE